MYLHEDREAYFVEDPVDYEDVITQMRNLADGKCFRFTTTENQEIPRNVTFHGVGK